MGGAGDVGFDEEDLPGERRRQSAAGLEVGMEQGQLMLFEISPEFHLPASV